MSKTIMTNGGPYRVWFINHGYYMAASFSTMGAALQAARGTCFECAIHYDDGRNKNVVATWSPFSGIKMY